MIISYTNNKSDINIIAFDFNGNRIDPFSERIVEIVVFDNSIVIEIDHNFYNLVNFPTQINELLVIDHPNDILINGQFKYRKCKVNNLSLHKQDINKIGYIFDQIPSFLEGFY